MRPRADVDQDRLTGSSHKRDVAWRRHEVSSNTKGSFDVGLACIACEEAPGNCEMAIAQHMVLTTDVAAMALESPMLVAAKVAAVRFRNWRRLT